MQGLADTSLCTSKPEHGPTDVDLSRGLAVQGLVDRSPCECKPEHGPSAFNTPKGGLVDDSLCECKSDQENLVHRQGSGTDPGHTGIVRHAVHRLEDNQGPARTSPLDTWQYSDRQWASHGSSNQQSHEC